MIFSHPAPAQQEWDKGKPNLGLSAIPRGPEGKGQLKEE